MPSAPERLTTLARTAAELLTAHGFAWGVQVATGTQITFEQALLRAAENLGDVFVVEAEYQRQADTETSATGIRVLPDPFAPGAADARIAYLGALDITDEQLAQHFGPNWQQVIDRYTEITAFGVDEFLARAADLTPVKTELRDTSWLAVREHAEHTGLGQQWKQARTLGMLYSQHLLGHTPNNGDVMDFVDGWTTAEAISCDALAAAALAGLGSIDDNLDAHLTHLASPWEKLSDRSISREQLRHFGATQIASEGSPDDTEIYEDDDYDVRLEDPVID